MYILNCVYDLRTEIDKSQVLIAHEVHRYLILPELIWGEITSRMPLSEYLIELIVVHKTDLLDRKSVV